MTNSERDAIEYNFPTYGDIVEIASHYELTAQLKMFIHDLCECCNWPEYEIAKAILTKQQKEGSNK